MEKSNLLELIKTYRRVSIRVLHKHLGIDPTEETHRSKVWQLAANLATLVRGRWIALDTSSGERVYTEL